MSTLISFLRLFRWFSLRYIRKNTGRALVVLLGVALGAGVFTSVRLAIHASLAAFSGSVDLIAGHADAVVVKRGGRIEENVLKTVLTQPAVKAAAPFLSTYVMPAETNGGKQGEPFLLIGIDPILDNTFRNWQARMGRDTSGDLWQNLMIRPDTLLAGKNLAQSLHLKTGDTLKLLHSAGSTQFAVIGILDPAGLGIAEGGMVAITDIATFQEARRLFGLVDRIDIRYRGDATAAQIATLAAALPAGTRLQPASGMKNSGESMIGAYQLNLSVLSFVSLFVGMFLVYSLVALNAAARRKEIAVLRAVGASDRRIFTLILAEGALFGILGWMLAIPIGGLFSTVFLKGVSQTISTLFVRVQVRGVSLSGWEILLSAGITIGVSVIAALQPAREAMRVKPKEAMAVSHLNSSRHTLHRHLAIGGTVMIALIVPLANLPAVAGLPMPGYAAVFFLFVGFSFLAPLALRRTGSMLSPIFKRQNEAAAFLAARYLRDSGTRTAVSVGALITAVALFTALVVMIHSFRETVRLWVSQTITGDLFVAAKMAEINDYRDAFSTDQMQRLSNLSVPVDVLPSRRLFIDYENVPFQLEGLNLSVFFAHSAFVWQHGDPKKARQALLEGKGVVVSEVFSNRTGLSTGDRFRLSVRGAKIDLPIVGVIRDYRTKGGVVFCSLSFLQSKLPGLGWTSIRFFIEDTESIQPALSKLRTEVVSAAGDGIEMVEGRDLRASILKIFDETFAVTSLLLVIALVVAALGITTTLTVLVLERTTQLNTLFALGGSPKQIRSMIVWEAALMLLTGLAAGLCCGFVLSYLLVFVINRQSFGWTFLYTVDWQTLGMAIPFIALCAIAAVIPALHQVFREPPATILRER